MSGWIDTTGNCMICGEPGGHGNLPCPRMQPGTPQIGRIEFAPYDPRLPGAVPVDYRQFEPPNTERQLQRIIELLEMLVVNTNGKG